MWRGKLPTARPRYTRRLRLSYRPAAAARPGIALLIGPEGGLTADEVAGAAASGWQVVSLGPRILRAETAALAAVTIALAAAGEFGT